MDRRQDNLRAMRGIVAWLALSVLGWGCGVAALAWWVA